MQQNKDYHPAACWFSRRTPKQRLSIHSINTIYPLKSKQQAATEHIVFILKSEQAITYSDWRASIKHFKTLCNWHLSADRLWICNAQINTAQLSVCSAVIVAQLHGSKVTNAGIFTFLSQFNQASYTVQLGPIYVEQFAPLPQQLRPHMHILTRSYLFNFNSGHIFNYLLLVIVISANIGLCFLHVHE